MELDPNAKDFQKHLREYQEYVELVRQAKDYYNDQSRNLKDMLDDTARLGRLKRNIADIEKRIETLQKGQAQAIAAGNKAVESALQAEIDKQNKLLEFEKKRLSIAKQEMITVQGLMRATFNSTKEAMNGFLDLNVRSIKSFLLDFDSGLKQVNRELGIYGSNAIAMTNAITNTYKDFQGERFLMSLGDIVKTNIELSKAAGNTAGATTESVKNMAMFAANTAIGLEGTLRIAGTMREVGIGLMDSTQRMTDILSLTEKVGVNATNVLSQFESNFKEASKYNFKGGVDAIVKMAVESERLKVNMQSTFAFAEKVRTLEGALETSARLLQLGASFPNADMYKLAFFGRNDPAKLAEITKNLGKQFVMLKDGQFDIGSAYGMDILREMAEATNQSLSDLRTSAIKAAQVDMAKKNIFIGSKEDKEFLAQLAEFQKGKGFTINVAGETKLLEELTKRDLDLLKGEQRTNEQRLEATQEFDKVFKSFIVDLKTFLLPVLKYMQEGLQFMLENRKMIGEIAKWAGGILVGIGVVGSAILTVKKFIPLVSGIGTMFGNLFGKVGGLFSGLFGGLGKTKGATQSVSKNSLLGIATSTEGTQSLTAFSTALNSVAAALYITSEAAKNFGEAFKGMQSDQIYAMSAGMVALTAAIAGVGLAVTALANPASLAGIGAFAVAMGSIAAASVSIGYMTEGIAKISNIPLADSASYMNMMYEKAKLIRAELEAISDIDFLNLKKLEDIANKGIKLQLSEVPLQLNIDVINEIDGDKFVKKFANKMAIAIANLKKDGTM